jgi:hypothetical protein
MTILVSWMLPSPPCSGQTVEDPVACSVPFVPSRRTPLETRRCRRPSIFEESAGGKLAPNPGKIIASIPSVPPPFTRLLRIPSVVDP